MRLEATWRTHPGRVRRANEDAVFCDSGPGIWAVADGMGGHAHGAEASATVVEALAAMPSGLSLKAMEQAIRQAMAGVNERLVQRGQSLSPPQTVGSTIVILCVAQDRYLCGWAGDSRAYLVRAGEFRQLSRDHTLVQQLVDGGLLTAAESVNHPDGHIITRAAGAQARLELDFVSGPVLPGDTFLLCSDGLSRTATPEELFERSILPDAEIAAESLLDLALQRGAPDNVSLILLRASA